MGPLGTQDLQDSLAPQGRRGLEVTLCPVYPETLAPPEKKETLEIQVTQDSRVLQVFVASLDLMELKDTKDSLDFPDYLDDKDLKVLLEIPEKKDAKARVMVESQALQGSQAPLDSRAQQDTLLSGQQDPLASQGDQALRGLKESLAPPAMMDYQDSWVWLGALDQRAREDRMGLQVYLVPRGPHLISVMQESLVPEAFWALRGP